MDAHPTKSLLSDYSVKLVKFNKKPTTASEQNRYDNMIRINYTVYSFNYPRPISLNEYENLRVALRKNPNMDINPPSEFMSIFRSKLIFLSLGIIGFALAEFEIFLPLTFIGGFIGILATISLFTFLPSLLSFFSFVKEKSDYYKKLKRDILSSTDFLEFTSRRHSNEILKKVTEQEPILSNKFTKETAINNSNNEVYMVKLLVLCILTLLAACFFDLEYGYYIFLRVLISFVAGLYLFLNIESVETGFTNWNIGFLLVFLLFNPVFPVPLVKETWIIIDGITAIFLGLKCYQISGKNA